MGCTGLSTELQYHAIAAAETCSISYNVFTDIGPVSIELLSRPFDRFTITACQNERKSVQIVRDAKNVKEACFEALLGLGVGRVTQYNVMEVKMKRYSDW